MSTAKRDLQQNPEENAAMPENTELLSGKTVVEMSPDLCGTLLSTIPIPIFFRSITGEYITCNPAFEHFIGKSRSEIIGKNNHDVFPRRWADKECRNDQQIVLSKKVQRYEWQLEHPMGGMHYVYIDKAPVMNHAGNIIGFSGAITDISGVKRLEEELASNSYRLESLLNSLPVAIVVIDFRTHEILDLNPMAMVMLGYTREQLAGRDCRTHICSNKTKQCPLAGTSLPQERSEDVITDSTGKHIPVLKSTILTEIDNKKLLLECFSDISKQKNMEARLREMAEIDFLTGIFNRRHFIESAEREIARSKRYNTRFSVIMLDIDWFKKINDQFGHAAGDEILKGVAELCQKTLRETDIIGRMGGEEFAVLLAESDMDGALIVSERIRQSVASHAFNFDGQAIQCTVSLGVASVIHGKDNLKIIMKRADAALYDAKKEGRNKVCRG